MNLFSIPQLARNANRLREIVTILSKYGLADWINRLDLDFARGLLKGRDGLRLSDISHERRIRLALTELGTTFIKFGQMLSTRSDLIGPELAKELAELQTAAPADPSAAVRATIENELGKPIEQVFATFEEKPLASGSIGQVHRARLRDGSDVVVKVQHIAIESRVRNDLEILLGLADLGEQYIAELRRYRPKATAKEFQRTLMKELDFAREMRHLQHFARNFKDNKTVIFPTPHPEFCTSRVLTMTFLDGIKITEPLLLGEQGHDLTAVARRGAEIYLDMIFRDGFYHADPHPGNVIVMKDGVIGMLDCGMVGRLDDRTREQIEEMLLSIIQRDALRLTTTLVKLGSCPPNLDQAELSNDVTEFLAFYGSQNLAEFELSKALHEITEMVRRYEIVLPPGIALLMKVLVMLEGTSRALHPQFCLLELMTPYQKTLFWRQLSPMRYFQRLRRFYYEWERFGELLPRGLLDLMQQFQTGRLTIHLEHQSLEPSVNRLVLGLLTSALFLGSALMTAHKVPPTLFDVSIVGILGCVSSFLMGLRLIWAIRKSGNLDDR